ncbi:MAG: GNAT family N-acetyltransferase [Bacteroidetes bacterium]|nr:GNAT family N-acetyltransferase [Bacteroidota bacterium]
MKITEVTNKRSVREFHKVPYLIYRNDPVWVCPLIDEVEAIFNPGQNNFFRNGEAIRWVLKDEEGNLIGRVAAFINRTKAYKFQQPTGGMGFFECIDDLNAAYLLFDKCLEWLSSRGMEAMDGPINFGENDVNWGLLVDGFTHPGLGMNYNPPYYRNLFESYGFRFYFEQVSNHLDMKKPFPDRFWKIADWVLKKNEFTFLHYDSNRQDKFIRDMKEVYDTAWAFHESFTPLDEKVIRKTLEKTKPFLDEELIWYAYNHEEPVAFLIMFPDVNQILKHLGGKLHLWNKIRFVIMKNRKKITRARIVIMGVKPKYQRHGVESGIFYHLDKVMKSKPYITEVELSWVGDFNPKMRALHESVGAVFGKRHITYRKLFSGNGDFHRSSIIALDTKEKALQGKASFQEEI